MKKIFIILLLSAPIGMWAQTAVSSKKEETKPQTTSTNASPQRTIQSSVKVEASQAEPLPYDVNDIYMGRKSEFLNSMIVTELPADFPKYLKEWSVKDYNAVVDAYFLNHLDLLKEKPKQKLLYFKAQQSK